MAVSVLSVNLVTVLLIIWTVLLKRGFTRKTTCLWELIRCAGEESLGLYIQISTLKHPQPLIEDNYNPDKSKGTIVNVRLRCDFICDAVDLLKSMFSIHTLVLSIFYFTVSNCNIYYGVVQTMNINKGRFGSVMCITVRCTETAVNAAGFTVLIYVCSCTSVQVGGYTAVHS